MLKSFSFSLPAKSSQCTRPLKPTSHFTLYFLLFIFCFSSLRSLSSFQPHWPPWILWTMLGRFQLLVTLLLLFVLESFSQSYSHCLLTSLWSLLECHLTKAFFDYLSPLSPSPFFPLFWFIVLIHGTYHLHILLVIVSLSQ